VILLYKFKYFLRRGNKMAIITKDMTVAEVLRIDQGAAAVFLNFGLKCLG